jgi:hypothetical protein
VQAIQFSFDATADSTVRDLWRTLSDAGVPSLATRTHGRHRPHVAFAAAKAIPDKVRADLRTELSLLSLPRLWLNSLSSDYGSLFLSSVVDTELLAVHSAVHDVLAKRVRDQSAEYLPGSWVPRCVLAEDLAPSDIPVGVAALVPVEPVRAVIAEVAVVDTHTGERSPLWSR